MTDYNTCLHSRQVAKGGEALIKGKKAIGWEGGDCEDWRLEIAQKSKLKVSWGLLQVVNEEERKVLSMEQAVEKVIWWFKVKACWYVVGVW